MDGEDLRWLGALLEVTTPPDRLRLLAVVAEVSMHHPVVAFPPATVLGVLDAWEGQSMGGEAMGAGVPPAPCPVPSCIPAGTRALGCHRSGGTQAVLHPGLQKMLVWVPDAPQAPGVTQLAVGCTRREGRGRLSLPPPPPSPKLVSPKPRSKRQSFLVETDTPAP